MRTVALPRDNPADRHATPYFPLTPAAFDAAVAEELALRHPGRA